MRRRPIEERFWERVDRASLDECWLWVGSLTRNGYGQIGKGGRGGGTLSAHRLSYEIHYGAIPEGLFVCHHCDVKVCVNPKHLYAGTPKDNMDDMFARGRDRLVGERSTVSKLTDADVGEIKSLIWHGVPQGEIAEGFSVSEATISMIKTGKRWKHVKGPNE